MTTSTFYALLAITALISSSAAAQESSRKPAEGSVAIVTAVEFDTSGISRNLHEREFFVRSFTGFLGQNGWSTMETPVNIPCTASSDCLRTVARQVGTKYVVRTTGKGNVKYGYTMQVEVYSSTLAASSVSEAYCDICNAARMGEIAAGLALQLLASTKDKEAASALEQRPSPPPLPASPRDPPLPNNLLPPPPSPPLSAPTGSLGR